MSSLGVPLLPVGEVLKTFRRVDNDLRNLGRGSYKEVVVQYQQWSNEAARMLGYAVAAEDIERLILTQRYWLLQTWEFTPNSGDPANLVETEKADRLRHFASIMTELAAVEKSWTDVTASVLAADTNVYLHHETYFHKIDWRMLANSETVRLLVPAMVVRELDQKKHAAKNVTVSETNKESVRDRARRTGRLLHELFPDPKAVVELAPGVELELVLNPLRHVGLEDTDNEIIDQMSSVQQLTGHRVTIVTNDRLMEFNAKAQGLAAVPGPEVPPPNAQAAESAES